MSPFYQNLFRDIPEPDRQILKHIAIRITRNINTVPDTLEIIDQLESDYETFGLKKVLKYYRGAEKW